MELGSYIPLFITLNLCYIRILRKEPHSQRTNIDKEIKVGKGKKIVDRVHVVITCMTVSVCTSYQYSRCTLITRSREIVQCSVDYYVGAMKMRVIKEFVL